MVRRLRVTVGASSGVPGNHENVLLRVCKLRVCGSASSARELNSRSCTTIGAVYERHAVACYERTEHVCCNYQASARTSEASMVKGSVV
jgi:hypothetical protein